MQDNTLLTVCTKNDYNNLLTVTTKYKAVFLKSFFTHGGYSNFSNWN